MVATVKNTVRVLPLILHDHTPLPLCTMILLTGNNRFAFDYEPKKSKIQENETLKRRLDFLQNAKNSSID